MPKAPELHFSPRAAADIDRIHDYTEDEWGAAQAEKYILELKLACERLLEMPRTGRSADHIRPGYFVIACESHTVFYRVEKTRIVVVRILRQRMDFRPHL